MTSRFFGDWNLRACAKRGHETYAPDEPELRARLRIDTPSGEAWRCLRCEDFVVGAPKGTGPADAAPEVPRGRLLRDRVIMRLLAVERGARGILLLLAAYGVWHFKSVQHGWQNMFEHFLPLFHPLAQAIGWNIDNSSLVRLIERLFTLKGSTLDWIALGLLAYAAIEMVEAVGLWLVKRWGEYFAVIATSIFLPLEIRDVIDKQTIFRITVLIINVAAVVWLLYSKRLFGLRGGATAYHAEHSAESVLTVERAAAGQAAEATTN